MNPTLAKIMIIFVLTIAFLILIVLGYLFYKSILKPWKIRTFHYQKILMYAQIIIDSKNDTEEFINKIVKKGYSDVDLIKTAQLELINAKKTTSKKDFDKISFLDSFKNKIRRKEDGKKNKLQQIPRGEDKRETGREQRDNRKQKPESGRRKEPENPRDDLSDAKQRNIQTKPVRYNERKSRYFN